MHNTLSYKGYEGTVEYDSDGDYLYGCVIGIKSAALIYEGKSLDELKSDFQLMIDDYIEDCRKSGTKPEKPYTGKIEITIEPDIHRRLEIFASSKCKIIDEVISDILNHSFYIEG